MGSAIFAVAVILSAPALSLVPVQATTAVERERVVGQLFPSKLLPMGFEVGGKLKVSAVVKGQTVRAGQLLGQLYTDVVDAQVAQARAGVMGAQSGARLATDVASRNLGLLDAGSVSDIQSRQATTQANAATAQLAQAQAGLAQALAGQRRHTLRAPFDGTIVDAPDQTGGLIGPGLPVYILMKLDPLIMRATIRESLRTSVKPGTRVEVESVGSDAGTADARVKVVVPSADPQTHRMPIEVEVPNSTGAFVANTLARLSIPVGTAVGAVILPATALDVQGNAVFTVDANSIIRRVAVRVVGRSSSKVTAVPSQPLVSVVDNPPSTLADGQRSDAPRP